MVGAEKILGQLVFRKLRGLSLWEVVLREL
jgi:hypothetical protein